MGEETKGVFKNWKRVMEREMMTAGYFFYESVCMGG